MKKEEKDIKEKAIEALNDVEDDSDLYDDEEIDSGKGMAILAYLVAPIPYFFEKSNKYVKYHAVQGMNLFIIYIVYGIIYKFLTNMIVVNKSCFGIVNCYKATPGWLTFILSIIGLCISALSIIGIINVFNGKAKELPLINKIKIIKNK